MGQPFRSWTVRRKRMCSGSWSLSMGMNISTKSSRPTAKSSTLFLQVTVALRLAACISASSCKERCAQSMIELYRGKILTSIVSVLIDRLKAAIFFVFHGNSRKS